MFDTLFLYYKTCYVFLDIISVASVHIAYF
jgi:hypothetical protein